MASQPRSLLRRGDARLERFHEVDDGRDLDRLRHGDLLAPHLGLEKRAQVAPVVTCELVRLEVAGEALDHLTGERKLRLLHLGPLDGLGDLGLRVHVLGEEERLERQRVALRAYEAEAFAPRAYEAAERCGTGLPHRLEQEDVGRRCATVDAGTRKYVRSKKIGSTASSSTKRVISIERESSERSIASRSASSTIRNCPFVTSKPRTISSCDTSRSCVGHQRFCLMGVEHSRWRSRKETSDWRAAGLVAGASPTGIETSPKLSEPFQDVRIGKGEL